MNYTYKFPVVKGTQAGREYYIAMVPLKMLGKLFPNEDEYVLPQYRAQRRISENRIPVIKKYILNNRDNYVFSALAASIDGDFCFYELEKSGLGTLEVSMEAKFLINDGQHRKAAILAALAECNDLDFETISVVFYEDRGLARSQQMFTDLNKHAVKTSNSIAELYDSRDEIAVVTRNVIEKISFLNEYTDKEKDILGKYSSCLFTLNTFYNANKRILQKKKVTDEDEIFLVSFWESIVDNILLWKDLVNREITKAELREKYVICQVIVIQALALIGREIYIRKDINMKTVCKKMQLVDWSRGAKIWKGKIINNNGRIMAGERAIDAAAKEIRKIIELK